MTVLAKFQDRIVEIVRVADTVMFSDERGWVCICMDFEQEERAKHEFKWVPAETRFEWVREFISGE